MTVLSLSLEPPSLLSSPISVWEGAGSQMETAIRYVSQSQESLLPCAHTKPQLQKASRPLGSHAVTFRHLLARPRVGLQCVLWMAARALSPASRKHHTGLAQPAGADAWGGPISREKSNPTKLNQCALFPCRETEVSGHPTTPAIRRQWRPPREDSVICLPPCQPTPFLICV